MEQLHAIEHVVHVTEQICNLPAIPTQDWSTKVAQAVSKIAPGAVVCCLVTQINPDSGQLHTISTGIAHNQTTTRSGDPDASTRLLYLQDRLERLNTLGFEFPPQAWRAGLVAPLALLNQQWHMQPLGRVLAAQNLTAPTLIAIPITVSTPGFFLLLCVAFDAAGADQTPTSLTQTLAAIVPPIAHRGQIALSHVTNPKAWLTDREHEILQQLIMGHSVRVIAENLGRSAHTVHDHVKNLHKKIGASSRGELIAKALGHTCSQSMGSTPAPVVLTPGPPLAELKPPATKLHARPLNAAAASRRP